MIYFIEGARNTGKTFLINQLNDINVYKYPFKDIYSVYEEINDNKQDLNNQKDLFYITIGNASTIIDLINKKLLNDLLFDRSIFSDLVFAIQANRITENEVINWYNKYFKQYEHLFKTIFIYSDNINDNRNKDNWDIYNIQQTNNIYKNLFDKINYKPILFKNNFDNDSINKFKKLFKNNT